MSKIELLVVLPSLTPLSEVDRLDKLLGFARRASTPIGNQVDVVYDVPKDVDVLREIAAKLDAETLVTQFVFGSPLVLINEGYQTRQLTEKGYAQTFSLG